MAMHQNGIVKDFIEVHLLSVLNLEVVVLMFRIIPHMKVLCLVLEIHLILMSLQLLMILVRYLMNVSLPSLVMMYLVERKFVVMIVLLEYVEQCVVLQPHLLVAGDILYHLSLMRMGISILNQSQLFYQI